MATKNTAAVEEVEETTAEPTTKQLIGEGIAKVIEATGIDVQKNRYKAMRAIAYQAFSDAIEEGTFDDLVESAIANVDNLPSGWEIERAPKEDEKPVAKKTPAKAPAKKPVAKSAAAKPAARPRPRR